MPLTHRLAPAGAGTDHCALLAGLAVRTRPVGELAALRVLATAGVPLAFIDAAVHRLPDLLTLPLYVGVTALLAAAAATGHQRGALLRAVLAGAVLAGMFLALVIVHPGGIGAGDAKFGLAVGTVLGWYGWAVLVTGVVYAFLAAAAHALGLLTLRRASRKDSVAFGPFLIAGALAAIVTVPTGPVLF
jgi:leader peptidase (prepilin peptidase) / N-methyltransferase